MAVELSSVITHRAVVQCSNTYPVKNTVYYFFYVGFLLTVDNNLFALKVRRREELWRLLLGGEIQQSMGVHIN